MTKIKDIIQSQQSDCGPCCLAMLLEYYGYSIEISDLLSHRDASNGWSMLDLKKEAEYYGLKSNVYKVDNLMDLKTVIKPAILFWENAHFVVLEKIGDLITIVDPNFGHININFKEFSEKFSGYVMVCWKTNKFKKRRISFFNRLSSFKYLSIWKYRLSKKYFTLLLLYNISLFLTPVFISTFISDLRNHFWKNLVFLILLLISISIIILVLERQKSRERLKLEEKSTMDLYRIVMHQKQTNLSRFHSGDILSRLATNSDICRFLSIDIPNIVSSVLLFIFISTYLVYRVGILATSLIFGVIILGILNSIFIIPLIHFSKLEGFKLSNHRASTNDGITSHEFLFNSGAINQFLGRIYQTLSEYIIVANQKYKKEALSNMIQQVTNLFFSMLISILGLSLLVIYPSKTNIISLIMSTGMILLSPVMTVVSSIVSLAIAYPNFMRLVEVVKQFEDLPEVQTVQNGKIEIKGLNFKYPGMQVQLFHDFNLFINEGEELVVSGVSGSGKTTLINIILGIETRYTGEVSIGGINSKYSSLDLRKDICYISQPSKLFKGTVKENLKLYLDEYSPEELQKIINKLKLDNISGNGSFFENMPILEGGTNLSLGQRQRISLLRAFLGKYKFIILDEPTSNLDEEVSKYVFDLITELPATKIIITHDKNFVTTSKHYITLGES